MGSTELHELIFTVGVDNREDVMMCEEYDAENNAWILLPAPSMYRESFVLASYHGQVFLIPNDQDQDHPKTIEVYDPNQNTWSSLPDLPFRYLYAGAAIVDDKIIVYEKF
ncbi:hypothetical protein AVEN_153535-1 [Araneus ventricosus]|uniref:Uncharacterized protein n=1 Tax=Araneus ventricosus TaxID=182803 RepID=A0A4Y2GAM8_ARAVE|nr:hypothetical protein AVEN_153535-1 [Araneus ventricosus]